VTILHEAGTLPRTALHRILHKLRRTEHHALRDHERRRRHLLQGLGPEGRPADHVPPRLAVVIGRLGQPNAVLPPERLSRRGTARRDAGHLAYFKVSRPPLEANGVALNVKCPMRLRSMA